MMQHADLLVTTRGGGTIHTLDPRTPHPEAVAIRNGRILATGTLAELEALRGSRTLEHALEGRTLVPGFNDAHVHIWKRGHLLTTMLDLMDVTSIGEIRERVRVALQRLEPGAWLLGRGYNEARLREGRKPTRADLDDVSPHHPVLLTRTCAHIHTLNTRALERAGISRDTTAPPGGEIGTRHDGEPDGLLYETAFGLAQRAVPPFSRKELQAMIRAAQHELLSLGITSATDPAVDAGLLDAYLGLEKDGELPVRTNLLYIRRPDGGLDTLPLPTPYTSDTLRVTSVKFFADGGLSGATAKLSEPYRNTESPTTGVLRFDTDELLELALEAQRAGFQIGTHAIGDVALDQILDVYERLHELQPHPTVRHRIEHFGLPDAKQLQRAARIRAIAVPQAIFIAELGTNFLRYLPDRYVARCYPLRDMLDAGITVALSSDGPVVRTLNPLAGIRAAVTRTVNATGEPLAPEQAITAREALHAYTLGGATAQADHHNRGRLASHMHADMTILSEDPLTVPPKELERIRVERTFVGGSERYVRSEPFC